MLKETKKIIWLGVLALLLVGIIAVFILALSKTKDTSADIPVDESSNIVTDGEYIFFNSPEGNVMMMHAFETTPQLLVEGWRILSASDENLVLQQDEETVAVFNREEKSITETYSIKTDTAYCTDGAVYYKHPNKETIMQIDRVTKEDVVFLDAPVNDFLIFGEMLIVAQKENGVILFDYSTGGANMYCPEQTIKTVTFADNVIVYVDGEGNARRFNINDGTDIAIDDVKTDGLCFSKGIYFYVENAEDGCILGIKDANASR